MLQWIEAEIGFVISRSGVRVTPLAPNGKVKKDIEGKTSVFSSLPRLVDWKIYEPLFSDVQASGLHSGRT